MTILFPLTHVHVVVWLSFFFLMHNTKDKFKQTVWVLTNTNCIEKGNTNHISQNINLLLCCKELIKVCNDMRVNKWQNFHFLEHKRRYLSLSFLMHIMKVIGVQCYFYNVLQNLFFCVVQRKGMHKGFGTMNKWWQKLNFWKKYPFISSGNVLF